MNPLWKVYKSKVMKTLNPELEEDPVTENSEADGEMAPSEGDEAPNAVSQLAKKVGNPLAVKPEEPRLNKRTTGFWDSFATKWQQAAAAKQAEAAAAAESGGGGGEGVDVEAGLEAGGRSQEGEEQQEGGESGGGGGGVSNSFSKYASLGGGGEEPAFKWNFVTSKLAEL
ncbi:hypothetical protein JZ751_029748, partial [Albula glossodonta]